MEGFVRVAAAVPACKVADVTFNLERHLTLWRQAHAEGVAVVAFPELGLSAYTCRDLFFDRRLLDHVESALAALVEASRGLAPMAVVGAPLRVGSQLYNAAIAIHAGRVLGVVPKAYLPNYREFEEARWFRPGSQVPPGGVAVVAGQEVPFGLDVLFPAAGWPELVVGVEVCEDYWVHLPPHGWQISAGASVLLNLSASNFVIGKAEQRRLLARAASDRGKCAYVYVAAGPGESSTDLAFDADAFLCENGAEIASSTRFLRSDQLITADIDLDLLLHERLQTGTFGDCSLANPKPFRRAPFHADRAAQAALPLRRAVPPHPFLPRDPATLATRCWEMFEIQTNALATRMRAIGKPKLILGLSGGLDSTQAALVAAQALDLVGQPRTDLVCVTMPGFGTSGQTRTNAERLAVALGASFQEIPIGESSRMVLLAVGHPAAKDTESVDDLLSVLRGSPQLGDITLENVQARLRTLVLMTVANQRDGLVVGTGDLSEKALGWCTYAGDHISMYDVNAGIPKTLIQFVVRWVATERATTWGDASVLRQVLSDILDTPISPELLPPDAEGRIAQLTEGAVGPYELHDFFLFHFVRHGARPSRILSLAAHAFQGRYDNATLQKWLFVFLRRFFHHQFKRSCATDGPKVGTVALSPRGDWRMPSDAQVKAWLEEVAAWKG